jgi:hypothetical protein
MVCLLLFRKYDRRGVIRLYGGYYGGHSGFLVTLLSIRCLLEMKYGMENYFIYELIRQKEMNRWQMDKVH